MSDQPPPSGPDFSRPPQGWTPPPAPGQPGWAQPSAQPDQPQQGWASPGSQGWAPPGQPQPGYPAPRQQWTAPTPPPRRRRWPLAVGVAVLVVVVAAGALVVPSMLTRPAATATARPTTSSTALPLVTVSPAPQPTAQTVLTSGGDLGVPATFTSSTGTGTLTVTRATWTHAGRMAPPDGTAYLILEVTVTCASGRVDVSSLSLRTTSDPAAQSAFGADLTDQFPGVRLSAGQKQAGQVGFVLAEGAVSVALLDPTTLRPVATRAVPGP